MMTTKKIHEQEEEEDDEEKPNPDRISELPEEIVHRILGFLQMEEVLKTSLVSTKWRNLWKFVPILRFPRLVLSKITPPSRRITPLPASDDSVNKVEKYQNFVDHVLRLRNSEASKIQIFNYHCDYQSREDYTSNYLEHLHSFIVCAVNQGAEEIRVRGCHTDESIVHFNPSIFMSGAVKVFDFMLDDRSCSFGVHFPRSMCFATQLTDLRLKGIRFPEGDALNAQLQLVFPVLEKLCIYHVYIKHLKVLDISASRLNTLTVQTGTMRYGDFDVLGGCRIQILTRPGLISLGSFGYSSRVCVQCHIENLPLITNASLSFSMETGTGMVEETTSFEIKLLLKALRSAESLTMSGFEIFSQDTLKELLTPFTSLRSLKLVTGCRKSSIHGMVHLLNSCNSIENIHWIGDVFPMVGSDEHLILPQCTLSHLKHVYIESVHGHKNEIEFMKFLLKNAIVLEDMIIQTNIDAPKESIEENLKLFIKELPPFRRSIKLEIFSEDLRIRADLRGSTMTWWQRLSSFLLGALFKKSNTDQVRLLFLYTKADHLMLLSSYISFSSQHLKGYALLKNIDSKPQAMEGIIGDPTSTKSAIATTTISVSHALKRRREAVL